jgi:DNA-binding NarL/FixJ family response regulator
MSRAGVLRIEMSTPGELVGRYACGPVDVVLIMLHGAPQLGVDTVRRLLTAYPKAKAIIVGDPRDVPNVTAAVAAGAGGFLRWDASQLEVITAITHAITGTAIASRAKPVTRAASTLTERELQVLRGMSQGKSNIQIGRELFLSEDTIKTHARRLFRKMAVRDRAQAVAEGFRHQLLT